MAVHYFDKHAQEGNTFLGQLAREIGEPDDARKAERILKAVLHTLRDRLTLEESFQLMAQFPLFLKGIYASEWKLRQEPLRIRHIEEFIGQASIRDRSSEQDFVNTERATFLIKKVFEVVGQYVSEGEWQDVLGNLPKPLHPLITPALRAE
ncbi:MAG: DUF2267 domain-containing protein [Tunicatimonas sp.]